MILIRNENSIFLTENSKACNVKTLLLVPHVKTYSTVRAFLAFEGPLVYIICTIIGPKSQLLCLSSFEERDSQGSYAR